jgi:hypothetical protein
VIVSGALLQDHSSSRFGGPTAPGFDLADVAATAVAYVVDHIPELAGLVIVSMRSPLQADGSVVPIGSRSGAAHWLFELLSRNGFGRPNLDSAFRVRLTELGWIEGRNVHADYRWAAGNVDRLHPLANELVGLKPEVIFAVPTPATAAAQRLSTLQRSRLFCFRPTAP